MRRSCFSSSGQSCCWRCCCVVVSCSARYVIDQAVTAAGQVTFLIEGDANGYWELAQHIAAGEDYSIYQPPRYILRTPGISPAARGKYQAVWQQCVCGDSGHGGHRYRLLLADMAPCTKVVGHDHSFVGHVAGGCFTAADRQQCSDPVGNVVQFLDCWSVCLRWRGC